jgi:putative ABC transport system permease protein
MAIRTLLKTPSTAIAAIATLALAVGINLAVFGLIDRALLSAPPGLVRPERLFTLGFEHTVPAGGRILMQTTAYPTFAAMQDAAPAVAGISAWHPSQSTIVLGDEQIQASASMVSGQYFAMLGAAARAGRVFGVDDDRAPDGAAVVVLSDAFWRSAFAADPAILGRRFTMGGVPFEVVGVMPPGFTGHSATRVDFWVPLHAGMRASAGWDRPGRNMLQVGVRLADGATPAVASTQLGAAAGVPVPLAPLGGENIAPATRTIAYWIGAISVLVLAIGLANAATLLLVRGARRRREFEIKTALGASRGRLVREVAVEASAIAIVATVAAVPLAYWFDEAIRRLLLPSLAAAGPATMRTLAPALGAGFSAFVVAAAAGVPHLHGIRRLATPVSRRLRRAQRALLLVQGTLAVLLLAGAGLFGRSFHALASQDFGMRMRGVLLVSFQAGPGSLDQRRLLDDSLEAVRALPGVTRATGAGILPFNGFNVPPISVPGLPEPPRVNGQLPFLIGATPELFEILGLQVTEGRPLVRADDRGAPVAVVNETMARTAWPGRSAVGQCFRIGFDPSFDPELSPGPPAPPPSAPCREVVGVVRDIRQRSVFPTDNEEHLMQYFIPMSQKFRAPFGGELPETSALVVQARGDAAALAGAIRRRVVSGRTDLPFLEVREYAGLLEPQMRPWRVGAALLALFSALALTVAAVGLHAAFAHAVHERRREMAIRIAIGARPSGVFSMVVREAAAIAAVGVLFGTVAAMSGARWLRSMLYATSPYDIGVFTAAACVMVAVAVLATALPARQAARSDPSALLRTE